MQSHVNQRCLCTLLPLVPCSLIYERDVMRANGGQKRSISVLTIVDTFGRMNRWCTLLKTVPEYRMTALNMTRIWIELAVWAAMVSTAQFSLSGSHLMPSPGTLNQVQVVQIDRNMEVKVSTMFT